MKYAIMDNNGIIEDFENEEQALNDLDRIREENQDIEGDLKIIKILHIDN